MAVSTVSQAKTGLIPGKTKLKIATVLLSGTYTTGGEAITAKELGFRRLVSVVPIQNVSNATEATPVGAAEFVLESSGTKGKLKLLNSKTAAELANGITVATVKYQLLCLGY